MESQLSITEAISLSGFETIDFIIGIVYLILLLSLSLFISRDREGREKDTKDYFLAGNTLTWWAVGASLIAANISAEQIIGMSGGGYANGLSIAAYEIMAAIALLLIGKYFLPIFLKILDSLPACIGNTVIFPKSAIVNHCVYNQHLR